MQPGDPRYVQHANLLIRPIVKPSAKPSRGDADCASSSCGKAKQRRWSRRVDGASCNNAATNDIRTPVGRLGDEIGDFDQMIQVELRYLALPFSGSYACARRNPPPSWSCRCRFISRLLGVSTVRPVLTHASCRRFSIAPGRAVRTRVIVVSGSTPDSTNSRAQILLPDRARPGSG